MNPKIILLLILACSHLMNGSVPTVREQLESLNRFWIGKMAGELQLDERKVISAEKELIQLHLELVERNLRLASVAHLTAGQRERRKNLLDVLREYRLTGMFPVNHYHKERTPYFIDKYGTACAVGQLIIASGYGAVAQQIRQENNNGYIHDLAKKYPAVGIWAHEHGFTLAELAWIQPCYCSAVTPGTVDVSCHGGMDGYFVPDMTGINVKSSRYYIWKNSAWNDFFSMCGGCNLPAGSFRCTVTDSSDTDHHFYAVLSEPAPISITLNYEVHNCTATVTAVTAGGVPPYTYTWTGATGTGSTATAQCDTMSSVLIADANGCYMVQTFTVTKVSGINSPENREVKVYPNPVRDALHIEVGNERGTQAEVVIRDIAGAVQRTYMVLTGAAPLAVDDLPGGLYFAEIKTAAATGHVRFIKK